MFQRLFPFTVLISIASAALAEAPTTGTQPADAASSRPNIVYIMADDHAAHAISAYGSKINKTPHIDTIARDGMLLENCFATNAICSPSRATILTSKYSHKNGVYTHSDPPFDGSQVTYPKLLQKAGYQTAVIGKWHLKSDPTGFDYWNIFVGQGRYHNPIMIEDGEKKTIQGYATDVVTDAATGFLDRRDPERPFCLLVHHKAPHRPWQPDEKHAHMYENEDIPQPPTLFDDYTSRTDAARRADMRILGNLYYTDVKSTPPAGLNDRELTNWYYQRYIKDYLRCIASVDDNVGRLLDYLKAHDLMDNTVIIYTSDQGFFLGDHGWYDKRFMYEESLRMPFLVRYPKAIKAGTRSSAMITNLDFAPTLLDFAGVQADEEMQGMSFRKILAGETPSDWRKDMYYHFYEYNDRDHKAAAHVGVRDGRYKLIHFYKPVDQWELFDLEKDPQELQSRYEDPAYKDEVARLKTRLAELRAHYGDDTGPKDE